jgi:hypothetical protein
VIQDLGMHGLDTDADLRFLLHKELVQVALGKYHARLSFEGDVSIEVVGDGLLDAGGRSSAFSADEVDRSKDLVSLLGKKIERVEVRERAELVLSFEGGDTLTLYDSSEHYESYVIHNGADCIVV